MYFTVSPIIFHVNFVFTVIINILVLVNFHHLVGVPSPSSFISKNILILLIRLFLSTSDCRKQLRLIKDERMLKYYLRISMYFHVEEHSLLQRYPAV